jgi:hypothetical protein
VNRACWVHLTLTMVSQIKELRTSSLQRVKDMAQDQIGTFKTEHGGVGSSIDVAHGRLTTLQTAKNDVENARVVLEESRWHKDASKLAANIGVGLPELKLQWTPLDRQYALLHTILDLIPGVEESFTQKTMRISFAMFNIDPNKDDAGLIWERMTRLRDTATTVTQYAVLQKEYADALLDMCIIGCMNRRHVRIIDRIVREVASYPAVVGNEGLESKVKDASGKCRWMLVNLASWFFYCIFVTSPLMLGCRRVANLRRSRWMTI